MRKNIRLPKYDYSQNGMYFITICTENRRNLFWDVGAIINRPYPLVKLSHFGIIVEKYINDIKNHYGYIKVDRYVIMPNHVHMILFIDSSSTTDGRLIIAPADLSTVVQQFKRVVTRDIGFPVWQRSYYDHIIRNDHDYLSIWQYIDSNPAKWTDDEYYG